VCENVCLLKDVNKNQHGTINRNSKTCFTIWKNEFEHYTFLGVARGVKHTTAVHSGRNVFPCTAPS